MKTSQTKRVLEASISTEWVGHRMELRQIFDLMQEHGHGPDAAIWTLKRALQHARRVQAAIQIIEGRPLVDAQLTLEGQ